MGKKRIGVDNLDTAICPASGKVYADGSIILTPGALDELKKRGIAVVHGPKPEAMAAGHEDAPTACPPGCTCPACLAALLAGAGDLESLVLAVAGAIKADCHISDPEHLKTVSCQAIATIRDAVSHG